VKSREKEEYSNNDVKAWVYGCGTSSDFFLFSSFDKNMMQAWAHEYYMSCIQYIIRASTAKIILALHICKIWLVAGNGNDNNNI